MADYMYVTPIHAPYHRLSILSYFYLDQPQPAGTYINCKVKLKSLKSLLGCTLELYLYLSCLDMSTFLAVEIILVFLKSPYVNINDPKQLHLCIYYKFNIMAVCQREKPNK